MARLVNLTPHPMHLYPQGTPHRVDPATVTAVTVIPPSRHYLPVRFGQRDLGPDHIDIGFPVQRVALGESDTDNTALPEPRPDTWYIVSTLVALAHPDRADLLMPYGTIRDLDGNTIGATGFARAATAHSGGVAWTDKDIDRRIGQVMVRLRLSRRAATEQALDEARSARLAREAKR